MLSQSSNLLKISIVMVIGCDVIALLDTKCDMPNKSSFPCGQGVTEIPLYTKRKLQDDTH